MRDVHVSGMKAMAAAISMRMPTLVRTGYLPFTPSTRPMASSDSSAPRDCVPRMAKAMNTIEPPIAQRSQRARCV